MGKKGDEMPRLLEQVPLVPRVIDHVLERCLSTRFCLGVLEVKNHRAVPPSPALPTPHLVPPSIQATFLHQMASTQMAIILRRATDKHHPPTHMEWTLPSFTGSSIKVAPLDEALAGVESGVGVAVEEGLV